ncbi:MAG TPA: hypothetical protein DIT65_02630 [Cryomorphaceae bacterium]|nr:hypothetical protein [Cryomorphaceae bacterium]
MMRRYISFFTALLFLLSATGQNSQSAIDPSVLSAQTDSSHYLVGGIVEYTLEYPFAATSFSLDTVHGLLQLEERIDTVENYLRHSISFLVVDSGTLAMPKVTLDYTGDTYTTDSTAVSAHLIPLKEGKERAAYRALKSIDFNFSHWISHYKFHLLGLLLVLAVAYPLFRLFSRKINPKNDKEDLPEKDWFADTMTALAKLREEQPWEIDAKGYYTSIADILRRYLSVQTGLPLSEQTTSENLAKLRARSTSEEVQRFEFIMTRADFVKFAKGQTTVQEHLDCLQRAEQLVLDFKPKEKNDGLE